MPWYLISSFIVVVYCLQQYSLAQTTTVRPYKFGFTIEEQQHRYEKRDERGIVMGEFGFITADGIYHVTVYATDEQGRFRILAMKNYPYESPPKSVEVLVKPKIPITTTQKPVLTSQNFYTEACSGCFLKNGKNKPKGLKEDEKRNIKTEIRTLSQALPGSARSQGPLQGTQSKSPIGKNIIDASLAPTLKSNEITSNILNTYIYTPLKYNNNKFEHAKTTQSQTSSLTPLQQRVIEHTPATLLTKHSDDLKTYYVAKPPQTREHLSQEFPKSNLNENNIIADTTKTVNQSLENRLKNRTNNKDFLNPTQTVYVPTAIFEKNIITHTQTPTIVAQQNTTLFGHSNENAATPTTTTENIATEYTQTQTLQNPSKSKTHITVDKQDKPILNSAQTVHVPIAISRFIGNSVIRHTQPPTTFAQQNTTPIAHSNESSALPTTTNKYSGNVVIKIKQTPTTVDKPYTTALYSTATNPRSNKLHQASPGSTSTATKQTENTAAIMDIIIGKVLPTLMANKSIKPNVPPSGKVVGSTKAFIPAAGNPAFDGKTKKESSNPRSAANGGDGDLYRFKYILDYHGHTETGKRNGNKEGNYFAIGDDNVVRTIEYVANENGYQPRIRWRKLNQNESKPKENTLKDYEFVWFTQ